MDGSTEKMDLMRKSVSLHQDIKSILNGNTSSHIELPKKNDGKGAIGFTRYANLHVVSKFSICLVKQL